MPICAICFQEEPRQADPFVRPCACTDRWAHTTCLQRWALSRPTASTRCEVCVAPYWGSEWLWYAQLVAVWLAEAGQRGVAMASRAV